MRKVYILERMEVRPGKLRWTLVVPRGSRLERLAIRWPGYRLITCIESARLGNDCNYSRIWFGF